MSLCHEVTEQLGSPLSAELERHVQGCPSCQAAIEAFAELDASPPGTELPGAMLERLRAPAMRELEHKRAPLPWWGWATGLIALEILIAVGSVFALGRAGIVQNKASLPVLWMSSALLLIALGVTTFVALAPFRRGVLRSVAIACLAVAAGVLAAGSGFDPGGQLLTAGMKCAALEVGISLPSLLAALWILTRSAHRTLSALLAGAAGGLVGLFALHLHCPIGTVEHLALFHVVPWSMLMLAATVLRARLPTRSFAP